MFLCIFCTKYIKSNVLALEQTRSYSQHLPNFLKGKPKPFVDHCVRRMAPNVEFIHQDETSKQQSPDSPKLIHSMKLFMNIKLHTAGAWSLQNHIGPASMFWPYSVTSQSLVGTHFVSLT